MLLLKGNPVSDPFLIVLLVPFRCVRIMVACYLAKASADTPVSCWNSSRDDVALSSSIVAM